MRVSEISYKPIEGGTLGGHFALHIRLGVSDDPESVELSSNELASKIHDAYDKVKSGETRLQAVLIDSLLVTDVDSSQMIELLATLRDWKFFIIAWVEDYKRAPWFELVNYLTVFIRKFHWPNFKVTEIRYSPIEQPWIEPEIYPVNANAPCYIDVVSVTTRELVAFIMGAHHPWGVIRHFPVVSFPLREKK